MQTLSYKTNISTVCDAYIFNHMKIQMNMFAYLCRNGQFDSLLHVWNLAIMNLHKFVEIVKIFLASICKHLVVNQIAIAT